MNYKYSGVVPYILIPNKGFHFLLGKERREGYWSAFSGEIRDTDKTPFLSAIRNFIQETNGMFLHYYSKFKYDSVYYDEKNSFIGYLVDVSSFFLDNFKIDKKFYCELISTYVKLYSDKMTIMAQKPIKDYNEKIDVKLFSVSNFYKSKNIYKPLRKSLTYIFPDLSKFKGFVINNDNASLFDSYHNFYKKVVNDLKKFIPSSTKKSDLMIFVYFMLFSYPDKNIRLHNEVGSRYKFNSRLSKIIKK